MQSGHAEKNPPRLAILLNPEQPDVGTTFAVSVNFEPETVPEDAPLRAELLDGDGSQISTVLLARDREKPLYVGDFEVTAPETPGQHRWTVVIRDSASEDLRILTREDAAFETRAHAIRPVVWGVPAATEAGEILKFDVGLRCTAQCCASGWKFSVLDEDGEEVFAGAVGEKRAPGTELLHFAEVAVPAPSRVGRHVWSVRPKDPECDLAHETRSVDVVLIVADKPDGVIRVRALDAATMAPIERAKVVAHPFRTFTDAEGNAEVPVPAGSYTVFVSGQQYFPLRYQVDVKEAGDIMIEAVMHLDRAYDEVDQWA